jgi:Zn-dependent protease with chaperone function
MQARKFSTRALALTVALLMTQPLALPGQIASPTLPNPGSPSLNKEQQKKLGLQAAGEVYKQMPVLPDSSPETRYIQRLGKKLEAVIPAEQSWPYQFHVIQASDINAFALPGGPIFVNVGTITAAEDEAQLAGVLAHEMSHVYMQHSAKQMGKANWTQILAGLAGAVLPDSTVGNISRGAINIGAGTILMKYSRKDEAQADAVGAVIMYRANYNPRAMADFFETLEKKYGNSGPQFLSDHPNPGNRTQAVQQEVRNWPPKNYAGNNSEFASVKQDAGKVKAYSAQEIANGAKSGFWAQENKKNGSWPANLPVSSNEGGNAGAASGAVTDVALKDVVPSGKFTQLQGQGFTISYPDNWKAATDQGQTMIVPPSGASQEGISYGVIVGAAASSGTASQDEATRKLAESLQEQNQGMRIVGEVKPVAVNGIQGRALELAGNSPLQENGKPLPERDWLVTVPRPQGGLLWMVFVSPERDFNLLHPTFEKMLDSLQLY